MAEFVWIVRRWRCHAVEQRIRDQSGEYSVVADSDHHRVNARAVGLQNPCQVRGHREPIFGSSPIGSCYPFNDELRVCHLQLGGEPIGPVSWVVWRKRMRTQTALPGNRERRTASRGRRMHHRYRTPRSVTRCIGQLGRSQFPRWRVIPHFHVELTPLTERQPLFHCPRPRER